MGLTNKHKRIIRWVGYPLLAIVTFLFTAAYTFPYDRVKDRLIEVLSQKYDVTIASIEPGLMPGHVVISTLMLKTRPKTADEKAAVIVFDEIDADLGILPLALWWTGWDFGGLDVGLEASVGGGVVEGVIHYNKKGIRVELDTEMLPLGNLPGVRDAVGLPMAGGLNAEIRLRLPQMKWSEADGGIKLSCVGCTVGDGKARLKMKPDPKKQSSARARRAAIFASEGLTVPRLSLGSAVAEVEIKKGVGSVKTFTANSKDGLLKIEGEVRFQDPFKKSTFPGCMTFKLSEELKEREKKFAGIEAMLPPKARQPDGSFAIPTKGTLSMLRWDVRRQCEGAVRGDLDQEPTTRSRPTLTTKPATPEVPDGTGPDTPGGEPALPDVGEVDGPAPPEPTISPRIGPQSDDVRAAGETADDSSAETSDDGESEGDGDGEGESEEGGSEGGEGSEGDGDSNEGSGEGQDGDDSGGEDNGEGG